MQVKQEVSTVTQQQTTINLKQQRRQQQGDQDTTQHRILLETGDREAGATMPPAG